MRNYLLAQVKELTDYKADGIYFDAARTHAGNYPTHLLYGWYPQWTQPYLKYGYNEPEIAHYKKLYGSFPLARRHEPPEPGRNRGGEELEFRPGPLSDAFPRRSRATWCMPPACRWEWGSIPPPTTSFSRITTPASRWAGFRCSGVTGATASWSTLSGSWWITASTATMTGSTMRHASSSTRKSGASRCWSMSRFPVWKIPARGSTCAPADHIGEAAGALLQDSGGCHAQDHPQYGRWRRLLRSRGQRRSHVERHPARCRTVRRSLHICGRGSKLPRKQGASKLAHSKNGPWSAVACYRLRSAKLASLRDGPSG